MKIPLLLDRTRPASLTSQIVEQIRDAVRQGWIAAGLRLPSSRRLAEQLEVSRNTVVRAYDILIVEGYVESRPASGMYAPRHLPGQSDRALRLAPPSLDHGARHALPMPQPRPLRAPDLPGQNGHRVTFDFAPGRPNPQLFPLKTWRRLVQRCISHGGAIGLSQYADPAGLPALRGAIANHVAATRGIIADASRIVIVSGIQEGITIAARLLLRPGVSGAIESPCWQRAALAFEQAGAHIVPIPVDDDGLIADRLPRGGASVLYVTPSHQYPTGCTMTLTRRHDCIDWARQAGCYLLEDDYDSDLRYDGSPLPALAAFAPDCTVYLGSFSKSLGAGLRLGYMIVPAPLVAAVQAAKALLNSGTAWLEQAALAEMMRSGSFAAHLARVRARYRENRDSLLAALRRCFGEVRVSGQAAGLHLLWHLPPGVPDAPILEAIARRARIGIHPLASAGVRSDDPALARRSVILGYAALQPRQIEQGIARLSDAIDDALEPASAGPSAYLATHIRHQPALRAGADARASSVPLETAHAGATMPVVSGIYRYPIKGLSPQRVPSVTLLAGQPFPSDRRFALLRPDSPMDIAAPKWAKKGLFVMLMLDEALARVRTHLDIDSLDFAIMQGNQQLIATNLGRDQGRAEVEEFFHQLVPTVQGVPRLVCAESGHFMDKPDNVLSLINLATVRGLEQRWGVEIDPMRFRANFYVDGVDPWAEFDWIGREIVLGDAVLRVDRRNGRCGATNVNPLNGRRDLDIPGSLRAAFGHKDLGVYVVVRKSGGVAVGDPLQAPRPEGLERIPAYAAPAVSAAARRFICRGCYFIYDETCGLPQQQVPAGTHFAALAASWRCPDCGTAKANFRPY